MSLSREGEEKRMDYVLQMLMCGLMQIKGTKTLRRVRLVICSKLKHLDASFQSPTQLLTTSPGDGIVCPPQPFLRANKRGPQL